MRGVMFFVVPFSQYNRMGGFMFRANAFRVVGGIVVGVLATAVAPAYAAEAGTWLVRGRVIHVAPNDNSGEVTTLPGSGVNVGKDTTLEVDFTRRLDAKWGLELILGTTRHDLGGTGTIAALGKIGEVGLLPPTLTLQYHFIPGGTLRPYAGLGLNYTLFYGEKSTNSLDRALGGATTIRLKDSWGLAAQAGVDLDLTKDWFLNLDAKYIQMDTRATLNTGGVIRTVDVTINPWVLGVGLGRRF